MIEVDDDTYSGNFFFDLSGRIVALEGNLWSTIITPYIGYEVPWFGTDPYIKLSYPFLLKDADNTLRPSQLTSIEFGIQDINFVFDSIIDFKINLDLGSKGIKNLTLPNLASTDTGNTNPGLLLDAELKIRFCF